MPRSFLDRIGLVLWIFVVPLCVIVSSAKLPQAQDGKTPTSVVKELFAADEVGTRLTPKGWYDESNLFIRPQPFPGTPVITVMKGSFVEGQPQIAGDQAQVGVECLILGTLDSSLRFKWAGHPLGPVKSRYFYTLIRTRDYWKFDKGEQTLSETKGSTEWRIRDFQSEQVLTIDSVIHYIESRRKLADPTSQKNADKSLALLMAYR